MRTISLFFIGICLVLVSAADIEAQEKTKTSSDTTESPTAAEAKPPAKGLKLSASVISQLASSSAKGPILAKDFPAPGENSVFVPLEMQTEKCGVVIDNGKSSFPCSRVNMSMYKAYLADGVGYISLKKRKRNKYRIGGFIDWKGFTYSPAIDTVSLSKPAPFLLVDHEIVDQTMQMILKKERDEPAKHAQEKKAASKTSSRTESPADNDSGTQYKSAANAPESVSRATLAIETDYEFYQRVCVEGHNREECIQEALAKIHDFYGSANVIVMRDLRHTFSLGQIFLYTRSDDPWEAKAGSWSQMDEVRAFWRRNQGRRDLNVNMVQILTGRFVGGSGQRPSSNICIQKLFSIVGIGEEEVESLARHYEALKAANNTWIFHIIVHELGHNHCSPHTHWYNPPIDCCARGEDEESEDRLECYRQIYPGDRWGDIDEEARDEGEAESTLMSYCDRRQLRFHRRVQRRMNTCIEEAVEDGCFDLIQNRRPVFRGVQYEEEVDWGAEHEIVLDVFDPDGHPLFFIWDFISTGDIFLTDQTRMTRSYMHSGFDTVNIYAIDSLGAVTTTSTRTLVVPYRRLGFEHDEYQATQGVLFEISVELINRVTLMELIWDFGDGTPPVVRYIAPGILRDISEIHTYQSPGEYTVRAAMNDGNRTYADEAQVHVLEFPFPMIRNLREDRSTRLVNMPAHFFAEVSLPQDLSIESAREIEPQVIWEFGDGTESRTSFFIRDGRREYPVSSVHRYRETGTYRVSARIETNVPGPHPSGPSVRVPIVDGAPYIDAVSIPRDLQSARAFEMVVLAINPTGHRLIYEIDFGDHSAGFRQQVEPGSDAERRGVTALHSYAIPGQYTIDISVTDHEGRTSAYSTRVDVRLPINN